MAQWQELLQMESALQSQVNQLYVGRFPREIRHHLSVWIESQDWRSAAADENVAKMYFQALLANLEEQRMQCFHNNGILLGPDYSAMTDYLMKHFADHPLAMAVTLSECLNKEKRILTSSYEAQINSSPSTDQNQRDLDNRVKGLREQTWEAEGEIKSLEALNEQLDFIQKSWENQLEQLNGLSHEMMQQECVQRANFITQTKQMVLDKIVNILKLAEQVVQSLTAVELPEWKRRQQLACLGSPSNTCLDHLQTWFTTVAEVLQQIRQQLKKLKEQNDNYNFNHNSNMADVMAQIDIFAVSLFKQLFQNALVVEKQPVMSSLAQRPLVLKTGVRFTVTVRFLANLPELKCQFKVKPVFDKDVEEVKTIKGFRQFVFTKDDSKVLDVCTPGGGLMAEFGHMSLKESKARTKGSTESPLLVTEELHVIKFLTDCRFAGLECEIETSSLPVVVVSATNQVPSAWASVMWFNMLSTSEPRNLSLFVDAPPLLWEQLSQVLSWQFLSVGHRELDDDQLSMLRDRIVDDPDGLVYWNKFSKNEWMWIWIDRILGLIKRHLKDFWKDGLIMGFVSKAKAKLLLKNKQPGNFVIRFSETYKEGAITFSWVELANGKPVVHPVEPYTNKDLSAESLPDIIKHFSVTEPNTKPLVYLYPDILKESVFGRYYTTSGTSPKNKDGYWRRKRVNVIDCITPPPSSPPKEADMDIEDDPFQVEDVMQELFPGLQDFCGSLLPQNEDEDSSFSN